VTKFAENKIETLGLKTLVRCCLHKV